MLVIEDDPTQSGLARMAIALRRPDIQVSESRDICQAMAIITAKRPQLALLGWGALRDKPERLAKMLVAIGFASGLSESDRQRALAAGVRAVYDRPADWQRYCDTLEMILAEWLP